MGFWSSVILLLAAGLIVALINKEKIYVEKKLSRQRQRIKDGHQINPHLDPNSLQVDSKVRLRKLKIQVLLLQGGAFLTGFVWVIVLILVLIALTSNRFNDADVGSVLVLFGMTLLGGPLLWYLFTRARKASWLLDLVQYRDRWVSALVDKHMLNPFGTEVYTYELDDQLFLNEASAMVYFRSKYRILVAPSNRVQLIDFVESYLQHQATYKPQEIINKVMHHHLVHEKPLSKQALKLSEEVYLDGQDLYKVISPKMLLILMHGSTREHMSELLQKSYQEAKRTQQAQEREFIRVLSQPKPSVDTDESGEFGVSSVEVGFQRYVRHTLPVRYSGALDQLQDLFEYIQAEFEVLLLDLDSQPTWKEWRDKAVYTLETWSKQELFLKHFQLKAEAQVFLVEHTTQALKWCNYNILCRDRHKRAYDDLCEACWDLIEEHGTTLVRKKRQYTVRDDYGVERISPKWEGEKVYFYQEVLLPHAKSFYRKMMHELEIWQQQAKPRVAYPVKTIQYEYPTYKDVFYDNSTWQVMMMKYMEDISEREMSPGVSKVITQFRADMTGEEYELFCMELLTTAGWNAQTTQTSGDFGIDVLARKESLTVVIQCKRYQNSVGISAVQEIIAGKAHMDADYAAVVTNSQYTSSAITLAQSTNTFLLHHEDLVHLDDILKQG